MSFAELSLRLALKSRKSKLETTWVLAASQTLASIALLARVEMSSTVKLVEILTLTIQ